MVYDYLWDSDARDQIDRITKNFRKKYHVDRKHDIPVPYCAQPAYVGQLIAAEILEPKLRKSFRESTIPGQQLIRIREFLHGDIYGVGFTPALYVEQLTLKWPPWAIREESAGLIGRPETRTDVFNTISELENLKKLRLTISLDNSVHSDWAVLNCFLDIFRPFYESWRECGVDVIVKCAYLNGPGTVIIDCLSYFSENPQDWETEKRKFLEVLPSERGIRAQLRDLDSIP
jgi:hypothetical protein